MYVAVNPWAPHMRYNAMQASVVYPKYTTVLVSESPWYCVLKK